MKDTRIKDKDMAQQETIHYMETLENIVNSDVANILSTYVPETKSIEQSEVEIDSERKHAKKIQKSVYEEK